MERCTLLIRSEIYARVRRQAEAEGVSTDDVFEYLIRRGLGDSRLEIERDLGPFYDERDDPWHDERSHVLSRHGEERGE